MKTSLKSNIITSPVKEVGEGFIPNRFNWTKPSSWPELRHITPAGAIGLLLSDKYPILSFKVTCASGNYVVIVDGQEYQVASNRSQCSINIADITTPGILISEPEPLAAHIVFIQPSSVGDSITAFQCRRTADTGTESQGLLWCHINMSSISLIEGFSNEFVHYVNPLLKCVTSCDDILEIKDSYFTFYKADLEYLPAIKELKTSASGLFRSNANLKKVRLYDSKPTSLWCAFADNSALEEVDFCNVNTSGVKIFSDCFKNNYNLKKLPDMDYSSAIDMPTYITNATSIEVPMLNLSAATGLAKIECFGTRQTPMYGFKGLLVSSSAPFSGSAPQINVSYAGLERAALVKLFNSLPQGGGSRKISIAGASGSADLTAADLSIAVSKGWEVLQ